MLPRMLAMASFFQTSRLRRHTGRKRTENCGTRRLAAVVMSIAQFAPGQLDEQILEVRRTVQVADAGMRCEVGKQRRGVGRIAERRLAGDLESRRERAAARLRPRLRRFTIHLDALGLDVRV